ncbi:MAG: cyclohexanone monooxygenase, partial [Hyphomicrobiaceae bacterium]
HEKAEGLLTNEIDSWMTGVNMNVEGKQTRTIVRYSGTAPEYRAKCDDVAAGGYRDLRFA